MNENPYSPPAHTYEQTPDGPRLRGPDYYYKPLRGLLLAHLGTAMLSIIGFGIIDVADQATESNATSAAAEPTAGQANPFETVILFAAMANFLMSIAWHVLFLIATARVGANSHALGKPTPIITPTFAMFAYFIPIVNLYKPYQALRQYYRACGLKTGFLLPAFWIFHLIYSASLFIGLTMALSISLGFEFSIFDWLGEMTADIMFIELPLDLATLILAQLVLTRLAARQAQLARQLPASSSPPTALNELPPMRFSSWGGD